MEFSFDSFVSIETAGVFQMKAIKKNNYYTGHSIAFKKKLNKKKQEMCS